MVSSFLVVLFAVTALVVVAAALGREVLALRGRRDDLDLYLRWLMENATGPVSFAAARSGRSRS